MNYITNGKIINNKYPEKQEGTGIDTGLTAAKTAVFNNGEFIHFFTAYRLGQSGNRLFPE